MASKNAVVAFVVGAMPANSNGVWAYAERLDATRGSVTTPGTYITRATAKRLRRLITEGNVTALPTITHNGIVVVLGRKD
jgi:hypothetical protein